MRGRLWCVIVTVVMTQVPADAYRGLTACPDLAPFEPTIATGRAARRCERALARAGGRFANRALATAAACLERWQAGSVTGSATDACVGRTVLATGERIDPTHASTAEAVARARARARAKIARACSGVPGVAILGCDATGPALATCVLVDHAEHVDHVLDEIYGDTQPAPDPTARRCQRVLADATRGYVASAQRAFSKCLASRRATAPIGPRCLGVVSDGLVEPPEDDKTARALAEAKERFVRRVRRGCATPAVATLDGCASDVTGVLRCLACVGHREALLLVEGERDGNPAAPTGAFLDWGGLRNPIFALPEQAVKDQALVFAYGSFHLFSSVRFAADDPAAPTAPRYFFRSPDLRSWESFIGEPSLNGPGVGPGSPDVVRQGGQWYMTYQGRDIADPDPNGREIFLSISSDLDLWSTPVQLTMDLVADAPIIDGALGFDGTRFVLGFKDRRRQTFHVARASKAMLDGHWDPPLRALASVDDPIEGFVENYQFVPIDGTWRLVATGRDPDPYRCSDPVFALYTCDHEPFIFTIGGDPTAFASWTAWTHKRRLRIPFEPWNRVMHANTGYLVDWRAYDGFFYLSYAGSDDGDAFELRGHGKIGLARSRDLVHWRLPGDLRD
jgi:hypothetical protein